MALEDTQDADVVLYLFKITTPLEETLRFLGKVPPPAEHLGKAKRIIVLDDMSVKPHHSCCLPLTVLHREKIQWSAKQYSIFTQAVDEHLQATHDSKVL